MEKQNVKRIIPVIIIMLLVAILVIIGLFALKTEATGEIGLHKHDEIVFEKWESNNSLPTTEGNYYLSGDVTLSSTWNVPSGTTNLCLNGHGIIMTGYGSAIKVGAGITLKLYDCDTTTEHRYSISSPAANGAGVATVNDALTSNYQTFIGGYITGARVYVSAQNLHTFTGYDGYNVDYAPGVFTPGYNYCSYPSARSFMCGVNFSF